MLHALREAGSVTQDGWAARLGVSRRTVQRWERGEWPPDAGAESGILAYCRDKGLFRRFDRGPLAGLDVTPELLQALLAEARMRVGRRPAIPEEPAGSPPVRLADAPPSNLPTQLTSFVGREREIAAVRRAQAGTRLLTLTGAGGCGKTRLALKLADELLWAYPHGVYFVELAALADPALVPETVAAALGLQTMGPQPPLETLKAFLRTRGSLLILDNCEHLLPACAGLVESLLRGCPNLEVLATSREPLGVGGEVLWRVPPMSIRRGAHTDSELQPPNAEPEEADAVRLFVERARQFRPDFVLTAANRSAVGQICAQLDGIPLAIELAAARLKILTVDQIAARLGDRFHLLTGGGRTALPRHQTLRAALDWSYDLLTAEEQALLRRLSVFAGGFVLEAVEAMAAGPSGLDLLTSLVDKSLVIAEEQVGANRYHLLATIGQYAAEKLDRADEGTNARDRHLAWYLNLAEMADGMLRGPHEAAWLARLEQEHDNLRAALRWSLTPGHADAEVALRLAGALTRFWDLRSHLREGRQWLERALAADECAPARLRAAALNGVAALAYAQGDYAAARALSERELLLGQDLEDRELIAEAQYRLGLVALRCGEHAAARASLEASLVLYTALGSTPGIAGVEGSLGFLALRQGKYAEARCHLEASVALQRELGNRDGIADALDDLATVAGEEGSTEAQAGALEECLVLYRELDAKGGVARVLGDLGMRAWMQGDNVRATALLQESLTLYRDVGERRGIARVLGNLALVALGERDYARAATFCRESLSLYRDSGDGWGIGRYLPVLAGACFGQGQNQRAARLCGAAAALRERLGTPLPPIVHRAHDRLIAAMRLTLGEGAFGLAWAVGEALSPEEAVDDALIDVVPAS